MSIHLKPWHNTLGLTSWSHHHFVSKFPYALKLCPSPITLSKIDGKYLGKYFLLTDTARIPIWTQKIDSTSQVNLEPSNTGKWKFSFINRYSSFWDSHAPEASKQFDSWRSRWNFSSRRHPRVLSLVIFLCTSTCFNLFCNMHDKTRGKWI